MHPKFLGIVLAGLLCNSSARGSDPALLDQIGRLSQPSVRTSVNNGKVIRLIPLPEKVVFLIKAVRDGKDLLPFLESLARKPIRFPESKGNSKVSKQFIFDSQVLKGSAELEKVITDAKDVQVTYITHLYRFESGHLAFPIGSVSANLKDAQDREKLLEFAESLLLDVRVSEFNAFAIRLALKPETRQTDVFEIARQLRESGLVDWAVPDLIRTGDKYSGIGVSN